jgi:hypothetical protein
MAAVDRCSDQTHQGQVSETHLEARLAQPCLVICHHRRGGLRFLPGLVAGKDALRAWLLWSDIRNRSAKHAGQPAHSQKTAYKLLRVTPEVYFGHDGLFCDGVYTTWLSLNIYFKSSSIDERQPRSLLFRFEKVVSNPYTGNQFIPVYQSVLIPAGAEIDIARLQHELAARCPEAHNALA